MATTTMADATAAATAAAAATTTTLLCATTIDDFLVSPYRPELQNELWGVVGGSLFTACK